jgi:hypothetical protein
MQRAAGSRTGGGRILSRIPVRFRMRAASWRVGENRIFSFFAQPKSGYGGIRFYGHCTDNYSVIFLIVRYVFDLWWVHQDSNLRPAD